MSSVDLGSLGQLADFGALMSGQAAGLPEVSGKPRMIPLADIDEDPNQPRKEFDAASLQEMADSIKEKGVKTPVSIRPNPDKPGRWLLNYGARRYRGSKLAGKLEIPAFVDDLHDDYDQVIENIQREDLAPMEIARLIARKVEEGHKKGQIAKKLGKDGAYVSRHLALLELPPSLMGAYEAGLCRDPNALNMLGSAYEQWADEIDALVAKGEPLSRQTVKAFLDGLVRAKHEAEAAPAAPAVPPAAPPGAGLASAGDSDRIEGDTADASTAAASSPAPAAQQLPPGPGPKDDEQKPANQKPADPDKIKKPIVQVMYCKTAAMLDGLPGRLLLERRVAAGLAVIKYDHDGSEETVDVGRLIITAIVEGV